MWLDQPVTGVDARFTVTTVGDGLTLQVILSGLSIDLGTGRNAAISYCSTVVTVLSALSTVRPPPSRLIQ